ncbi:unnamed protein product [Closterium sp. NIES-54]
MRSPYPPPPPPPPPSPCCTKSRHASSSLSSLLLLLLCGGGLRGCCESSCSISRLLLICPLLLPLRRVYPFRGCYAHGYSCMQLGGQIGEESGRSSHVGMEGVGFESYTVGAPPLRRLATNSHPIGVPIMDRPHLYGNVVPPRAQWSQPETVPAGSIGRMGHGMQSSGVMRRDQVEVVEREGTQRTVQLPRPSTMPTLFDPSPREYTEEDKDRLSRKMVGAVVDKAFTTTPFDGTKFLEWALRFRMNACVTNQWEFFVTLQYPVTMANGEIREMPFPRKGYINRATSIRDKLAMAGKMVDEDSFTLNLITGLPPHWEELRHSAMLHDISDSYTLQRMMIQEQRYQDLISKTDRDKRPPRMAGQARGDTSPTKERTETKGNQNAAKSTGGQHATVGDKSKGNEGRGGRSNLVCCSHGISHQTSLPHTPQQNGVAEWVNRTVMDRVRAMTTGANLSSKFWPYALEYASWLHNRISCSSNPSAHSPYFMMTGRAADVSVARTFGCLCYYLPPQSSFGKFEQRGRVGMFLGLSNARKAWIVRDLASNVDTDTRSARFFDDLTILDAESVLERHRYLEEVSPHIDGWTFGEESFGSKFD